MKINTLQYKAPQQVKPSEARQSKIVSLAPAFCFSLMLITMVLIEFLSFKMYFRHWLRPYHLVNFDQVVTFMGAYKSYFSLVETGRLPSDFVIFSHQGMLIPHLALISTFVFGPHRLSINLVNFFFLAAAQVGIFVGARKTFGTTAALLALTFFLLSGTHFFPFGGLDDMRRDYAGMVAAGLAFGTSVGWMLHGSRRWFIGTLCAFLLVVSTRFIIMFYWVAGIPLALTTVFLAKRFFPVALKSTVSRLVALWSAVMGLCGLQVCLNWQDFYGHYVDLKFCKADQITWNEFGVHTWLDRLLYYPRSFWDHYHGMLGAASILFIALILIVVVRKLIKQSAAPPTVSQGESSCLLLLLPTLAGAFIILTAYSPSPIVLGAFSIPISICLGAVGARLMSLAVPPTLAIITSALMLIQAFLSFNDQFKHPPFPPHASLTSARAVDQIMSRVVKEVEHAGSKPITIAWMLWHDGLQGTAFLIKWYENRGTSVPVTVTQKHVPALMALPSKPLLELADSADFIVAPIEMPAPPDGWFEYPGITSVRRALPSLKQILGRDFRLIAKVAEVNAGQPNTWTIGLFKRTDEKTFGHRGSGSYLEGISHQDACWKAYVDYEP